MTRSLVVALVASATSCIAACAEPAAPAPAPVREAPAASSAAVRWVPARAAETTALLEAPATVIAAPAGRAVVTPALRARIVTVRVAPGATVSAGAPLVDVALPDAAAAAAAYLAALDELGAYERRGAQLDGLRQEGLVRAADVAAIELELARLRGVRDVAATTLRTAGLTTGDARALAASGGRTTLRAPITGVVTAVAAVAGATRGTDDPLVELAAGGATRVDARLPRPLPAGAVVEFVAPGADPVPARLVALAPAREPDGAIRAWFELDAPAPAGTLGRVRGRLPAGAATVIPAAAVAHDDAGAFVWTRDHDRPRRAAVHVLAGSGTEVLVEGLAVGDQVAASAAAMAAATPGAAP